MNEKSQASLRDHLANERTFLAWIRTAIAVIALGFVVERFAPSTIPQGELAVIGAVVVGLGALMTVFAFIRYRITESQLESGRFRSSSRLELAVTVVILLASFFLIFYLILPL